MRDGLSPSWRNALYISHMSHAPSTMPPHHMPSIYLPAPPLLRIVSPRSSPSPVMAIYYFAPAFLSASTTLS